MLKKIRRFFQFAIALFFCVTILWVVMLRFVPVFFTELMIERAVTKNLDGVHVSVRHTWVSLDKISPHMPTAVMASEDSRFLAHHGFDFDAITDAAKSNLKGKRLRGGSTISQQTAKNVFLWQGRSWLRKGLEMYFTALIEAFWSKQRIMEVYLNSIEMGDGLFGVEAVAQHHFGKKASELTAAECALIAATLPNPRRFDSQHPNAYMRKRQHRILHDMKFVTPMQKEWK